jgi:hypothetical protein
MAAAENCGACSVRTIMEETEFIAKLKSMVDYGNSHVLRTFKVKIEFDEGDLT